LRQLAGTAHNVHVRRPTADQVLVFLGHAAEHADDLVGMPFFMPAQHSQGAVNFVFRVLTDATCVEQDYVGLLGVGGQLVALAAQYADDQLAVEHVHLAANGLKEELRRHLRGLYQAGRAGVFASRIGRSWTGFDKMKGRPA